MTQLRVLAQPYQSKSSTVEVLNSNTGAAANSRHASSTDGYLLARLLQAGIAGVLADEILGFRLNDIPLN